MANRIFAQRVTLLFDNKGYLAWRSWRLGGSSSSCKEISPKMVAQTPSAF
jgi:hypothetical protein